MDVRSARLRASLALVAIAIAWACWLLLRLDAPSEALSPATAADGTAQGRNAVERTLDGGGEPRAGIPVEPSVAAERSEALSAPTGELGELLGRLEGLELPTAYTGIRVVLWPDGHWPTCAELEAASARSAPVRAVSASADGTFRFEHLPLEGAFRVRAGGAAQLSFPLERPVSPAEAPVLLRLSRARAVRIELIEPEGGVPRTEPSLMWQGASFSGEGLLAAGALVDTWEEQLAEVPGAGCDAARSGNSIHFVLRPTSGQTDQGPIACEFRVPGYRPASRILWAGPVLDEVLCERVVLEPVAEGWGTLELELEGLSDAIRRRTTQSTPVLDLILAYGDGTRVQYVVRGADRRRTVDGIPWGSAVARLSSSAGFRWPRDGSGLPIRISSEPARLVADLSESGAIEVTLGERFGDQRLESFGFVLARAEGFGALPLAADRLPIFLPVVEPGPWNVTQMRSDEPEAQPTMAPRTGLEVRAGAITFLRLDPD